MKTTAGAASVQDFLDGLDPARRADSDALVALMKSVTRAKPVMWGPAIIGFGKRTLVYDSGRQLEWFQLGFSPRKARLSLYLMGLHAKRPELETLGKHKLSKGCLYIKRLSDVDTAVLKKLMKAVASAKPLSAPR
jgi:hypothetical protein